MLGELIDVATNGQPGNAWPGVKVCVMAPHLYVGRNGSSMNLMAATSVKAVCGLSAWKRSHRSRVNSLGAVVNVGDVS